MGRGDADCQKLDFGEYWADFRQRPNGSLGGGWNNDVESMPVRALHQVLGEHGHPRYLNWNLLTIEWFRNDLTGVNAACRRHFGGNHFDATRYALDLSPEKAGAEGRPRSAIAPSERSPGWSGTTGIPWRGDCRLSMPISWLAAAMSTAKGKPRGIVPSRVSFHDEVGGPEPVWTGEPGAREANGRITSGICTYLEPFQETW